MRTTCPTFMRLLRVFKMAGKRKIAVLYGGRSSEHEISIITALQAMEAIDPLAYHVMPVYISLDGKWYTGDALFEKTTYTQFEKNKKKLKEIVLLPDPTVQGFLEVRGTGIDLKKPLKVDVCFLCFHGQYGEDGCMQGLLELAGLPYTGCGVSASALAMNKTLSKKVAEAEGIPVIPYMQVQRREALQAIDALADRIEEKLQYPLFVKPVHLGSSIAISKAPDRRSLKTALAKSFQFDLEAIVEKCITNILEINIAVIDQSPLEASVVEIPLSTEGVLSYEDKYLRGGKGTEPQGMASLQRIIDPADLCPKIKEEVRCLALKMFSALGAEGIARFDFIYDLDHSKLYFNEINPIPGSLSYYLWEKTAKTILYPDIIRHMIDRAALKKREKDSLLPLVGFRALS